MAMTATTIEAMKKAGNHRSNVRKGLNAVAFLAPMTAELPTAITTGTGQLGTLPTEYLPLGLITKDGISISADASADEVEALGYVEAVRTDLIKAPKTVKLTVLEPYRRHLQELVYGINLSAVTATTGTGEITFDEAPLPVMSEWRLVTIMADGPSDDEWLIGRGFPRVKLAKIPDEAWKPSDPVQFDLEFSVFTDETLGTPCRHYIGGTGALAHIDNIGFTPGA